MTQLVAKYAMKKVMAKEMDKYASKGVGGPYVSTHSRPTHVIITNASRTRIMTRSHTQLRRGR